MRKKLKKICAALLSAVIVAGTIGGQPVTGKAAETKATTTTNETKLNITSKTAGVGVTKANRVTLQLKNPTGTVTWSSSDANRVKIYPRSNGTVWVYLTNYGNGKAVTVTATDKKGSYTCKLTPKKPSATKPFMNYKTYTGSVGDTVALKIYNYNGKITWKRSNTCAVVKSGKATLKKPGTVKVTATLEDGTVLTCTIKVTKAADKSNSIEKDIADIIKMVEDVMKVATEPHTIPAGCPENIIDDIKNNSDFNEKGKGITGIVDGYETMLYGDGQYNVRIRVSLNGDTYIINGTKMDGQVMLSSMADILFVLQCLNTSGDGADVNPSEDEEYIDTTEEIVIDYVPNEWGERDDVPVRGADDDFEW